MTLRARLNLVITALFALILVLGVLLVIRNAQQAVHEELRATSHLTLQLLEVALGSTAGQADEPRLLRQIVALETTRHLDIELRLPEGSLQAGNGIDGAPRTTTAPAWFKRWVAPEPLHYAHALPLPGGLEGEILLRADPADELSEAWEEARDLLGLVLLFSLVANAVVFVTIGRSLRPLDDVLEALDGIERGDYRQRLGAFRLPELARISHRFNRMAERLEQSTEENRFLTRRSLAIQEEERRHLARELHDELGQCLSAIKADAVSITRRSRGRLAEVHESAGAIVGVCNHMHAVVRTMMRRLRPAMLDELGLETTLREAVEEWRLRHPEVHCRLVTRGFLGGLGSDVEIALYRIAQECLTNIDKHADATEVGILLERCAGETDPGDGRVHLRVRDNGRGLDPGTPRRGLGLLGIAERVQALRGCLEVSSRPEEGVCIDVTLPLAEHAAAA
jgi:two-component system, NarL family, sensor histidine kinase UhpB